MLSKSSIYSTLNSDLGVLIMGDFGRYLAWQRMLEEW
jgi:hypothetical protein